MEHRPHRGVTGLMSALNHTCTALPCGRPQMSHWSPPSQQQYTDVTSRGQNHAPHSPTTATACVHPLVPLLLYSDRHVPRSSPFTRPIAAPAAPQAGIQDMMRPCHHGNNIPRQPVPVKKPLNAFMLYMKEMRHKVLQEGGERESAAINRILGRRWHALSRSEQSKYYDLAQKERQLHLQLYPGWSARDNYGKRKKKRSQTSLESCSSWTLTAG